MVGSVESTATYRVPRFASHAIYFGVAIPDTLLTIAPVITSEIADEVPPPGLGLNTVTLAAPGTAMSAAGMAACNWVAETNVVGRVLPFH